MAKYNKKLVNKICSLIKEDSYSIAEICINVGISERSYYDWKNKYADFADAIKRAEEEFNSLLVVECKKSLLKLIRGYTEQEKKTVILYRGKKNEDGETAGIVKEETITDKHYQPNPASIIFTITNRDPENWKNRIDSSMDLKADLKGTVPIKKWLKSHGEKKQDEK